MSCYHSNDCDRCRHELERLDEEIKFLRSENDTLQGQGEHYARTIYEMKQEIESLQDFIEVCNKNMKMVNDDRDEWKRRTISMHNYMVQKRYGGVSWWSMFTNAIRNPEAASWFEEE